MSERMDDRQIRIAIDDAIRRFGGYIPTLETAIGALFLGKALGWEVLYLVHNRSTIKKFEEILKIDFRAQMEPHTGLSRKHFTWVWSNKFKAFWKVVRGEIKQKGRTDCREEPIGDAEIAKMKMDLG